MMLKQSNPGICWVDYPGSMAKQWFDLVRAFKISRLWSLGPEGDVKSAKELPPPAGEHNALIVITAKNANLIRGEVSLADFYHPQHAIYLFGPDDGDLTEDHLGVVPFKRVYLPVDDLWAIQAATAVLYDRIMKEQKLLDIWRPA